MNQTIDTSPIGAASLAALLAYPERFRGKKCGLVITGGNIDTRLLASVLTPEPGLGVPDEHRDKLFEPFQPIELASGSISLGLRLPLAQAIVLSHGGTCGASQHSGGLSLWLTLPG